MYSTRLCKNRYKKKKKNMSVVLHVASLSLSLSGPINEGEKKKDVTFSCRSYCTIHTSQQLTLTEFDLRYFRVLILKNINF